MAQSTTTITIPTELLQETLIALRDRRFTLQQEVRACPIPAVLAIAMRQLGRVERCIGAIETAVGE